jgi:hypothetical protein
MSPGMDSDQKFKWGLIVADCMKQLRAEGFRFVDQEVITNFDGSANGISAWFICEHSAATERFDAHAATDALKKKMLAAGFPQEGVETLRTCVTSQTEIQAGGGASNSSAENGQVPCSGNWNVIPVYNNDATHEVPAQCRTRINI